MSSILRNRLQGEGGAAEEPQFNYPDLHADPATIYRDRFGLEEEHDRFLFPWIMNVIFELANRASAEDIRAGSWRAGSSVGARKKQRDSSRRTTAKLH